ncbi:MAG TPA: hypothetical protein PLB91_11265 [Spirochaetales bacterium]|nr:hypothetical protein [Spirochaetales bacterium]HRY53838.1 hypothetical protein [Spirochaetia bacterium]HRZ65216.1 hypothetical protein [Spirochaetia bacterium]
MKKSYRSRPVPLVAAPVFAALPFLGAAVGGSLDAGTALAAAASFVLALALHLSARRLVARVEGGVLRLYAGIGLAEVDRLELSSIGSVERASTRFLTIRYGEGKAIGLEADKAVLNELARDLAIFVGKRAGQVEARPSAAP